MVSMYPKVIEMETFPIKKKTPGHRGFPTTIPIFIYLFFFAPVMPLSLRSSRSFLPLEEGKQLSIKQRFPPSLWKTASQHHL